jgi:hypothetical protein
MGVGAAAEVIAEGVETEEHDRAVAGSTSSWPRWLWAGASADGVRTTGTARCRRFRPAWELVAQ